MRDCNRKIGPFACCSVQRADCRDILRAIKADAFDACITDPPWPDSPADLLSQWGITGIGRLWRDSMPRICNAAKRLVIHMGCKSDVRILRHIPAYRPFIRTISLRYARPSYSGDVLVDGDMAYAFGERFKSAEGQHVFPGFALCTDGGSGWRAGKSIHPTVRRMKFVNYLVHWFGGQSILDPFAGSGTTAVAAIQEDRHFLMIERDPAYCDAARERISREYEQPRLFSPPGLHQPSLDIRNKGGGEA